MDIPDMRVNSLRDLVMDAEWSRYTYHDHNGHSMLFAEYDLNGGGKLFFAAKTSYPEHERHLEGLVRFATFLPGDQSPPEETDKWSPTGLTATFFVEPFDTWVDDDFGDKFIPYRAMV